ncbi:arrestin domain-containing protein 1 [Oryzias latipes]|uniref:Arrestin domain containing 1 n=1 Tax=Oryzias latipes TaxID=8090 RepID=A0A3B3IM11_ORYLA|nr:arrestin domain-containing protein 1 [Oryzias latipes]
MGKLQEFDIFYTNNKVVYGPGESVSGVVRIRTSSALHYKAIKVNCQGSCGVSTKINDTTWNLEERYFNSTLSVADKGVLSPGEHSFPFQFLIPAAVPTSFEGPFGKVVYRVQASIDTPRFSKDYKTLKVFYLLNALNLNEVPNIEQPSSALTSKKFSYLLVKTGTLMLKTCSDLRGYVPGQVIKLSTEIHNKSGKDTGCVLASLIQKVMYKSKRPMFDLRTIAEVQGAGVKAGKHAEWKEQIIVPPLPQSALAGCSLIDIEYFIQVSLKSPEAAVILPIYIGNIPVNLSPSRTTFSTPERCGAAGPPSVTPSATPNVTPSAPPAQEELEGDLCAGGVTGSEEIPTKSHSQLDPSGLPVAMSPSAFSHAPAAALPPSLGWPDASAPVFCLSTGATVPFFTEGSAVPVPTSCPLILPPEYSSSDYPHEPPPTYEESCSTMGSSFNSQQ